ncbi:MAG: hypothetical protein RR795_08905 [Cetobacterium sp.]|uniref:hypothetical protein n=1 Tax=Cetobacterium sp. TaxID=2071632 RepID=UPI002FC5C914
MVRKSNQYKIKKRIKLDAGIYKNYLLDYFEKIGWLNTSSLISSKSNSPIEIPKIFSIKDNPNETLSILKKIFEYRYLNVKNIYIDFKNCSSATICASSVLVILLLNLIEEQGIVINTNLSNKKENDILFLHNGFVKYLNMEPIEEEAKTYIDTLNDEISHIKILKLLVGGKSSISFKRIASDLQNNNLIEIIQSDGGHHVVNFFNQCLKENNHSLKDVAISQIRSFFGEVLDNTYNHLENDISQFFSLGIYDTILKKGNLLMFNFGRTIYEGLKDPENKEILEVLNELTEVHKNNFNPEFNEETLWTLASLQKTISRCYNEEEKRGCGLPSLITSFKDLSKATEFPELTIISGRTLIKFNSSIEWTFENGVIAFNKENILTLPPSSKNVIALNEYFPGTLILFDFNIDEKWLIKEI